MALEALFDRKNGELAPLAWSILGLVLAVVGLSIFALDLAALLGGQQTVRVSQRPYGSSSIASSTISTEVRVLFGLFLGTAGVATVWRGLTLAYPRLAERWWVRWTARLVIIPLVFLTLVFTSFILANLTGLL